MANYTTSAIKLSVPKDGTVSNGEIAATGVILITPKPGYVVGHADFGHDTLPTGIQDVVFTTNGTPFTVGATVNATVSIASSFTMPEEDRVIDVSSVITGNARKINSSNAFNTSAEFSTPINASLSFTDTTGLTIQNAAPSSSQTGNVTVSTAGSGSSTVITIGGNVVTEEATTGSQTGQVDNSLAQQEQTPSYEEAATFEVVTTGGEVFDEDDLPSFAVTGFQVGQNHQSADSLLVDTKTVTQNSSGQGTGVVYAVMANTNNKNLIIDNIAIESTGKSRAAHPTTKEIKNLDFGANVFSEFGETRKIKVYGDSGATFDLDVVDSGGTSVLSVSDATIPKKGNLVISDGVYEKDVVIPAGTADKTYSVTITEKGSTIRGSSLGNFHEGFPTRFTKKQADSPVFTLKFTRQSNPLYAQPSESTLEARFDAPGTPIQDLRVLSLPASDTLSNDIVSVTREITTSDNSSWQTSQSSINSNLVLTNKTLFITTTGNDNYDSSKVTILNLSGTLSNAGGTNNKLTLTFDLLFNSLGDSNLTYNINIPSFILSNSGGTP